MHTVSIFVLFLLLAGSASNEEEKHHHDQPVHLKESYLKPIAEDFGILARIINGIYLQSAVFQQNIRVQHVLTELLQISPNTLNEHVMNVDTLAAQEELKRMNEALETQLKNPMVKTALFDETPIEFLTLTISYLRFLQYLRGPIGIPMLTDAAEISLRDLLSEAKQTEDEKVFKSSCAKMKFSDVDVFIKTFGPSHQIQKWKPHEMQMLMKNANKIRKEVSECMDQLEQLRIGLNEMKLVNIEPKARAINFARKMITRFIAFSKLEPTIFRNDDSVLQKLRSHFEITKPIWSSRNPEGETLAETMKNLLNSATAINRYNQDYTDTIYEHTAGFHNSSDLVKVYDDLTSPWFQEKVVKGASTKNIVKAFKPFKLVSEAIISLEHAWDELAELAEKKVTDETLEGLSTMVNVKQFAKDYESKMNNTDMVRKQIETCLKLRNVNSDPQKAEWFVEQEVLLAEIFSHYKSVQEKVSALQDDLSSRVDRESGSTLTHEQFIRKILSAVETTYSKFSKEDAIVETKKVEQVVDSLGFDPTRSFEILKDISTMAAELTEFKKAETKIGLLNTLLDVDGFVKEFKITEVANCLNQTITEQQLDDVVGVVETFINLRYLPSKLVIDQSNAYLNKLLNVQMKMEDISKVVRAMRSKVLKTKSAPLLSLNNSRVFSDNIGMCTRVLEEMDNARAHRADLENFSPGKDVKERIMRLGLLEWLDPTEELERTLEGIERTNVVARDVHNRSLVAMTQVFEEAAKVKGIAGTRENLRKLYQKLRSRHDSKDLKVTKALEVIRTLDLDFAKQHARLMNARVTVSNVQKFFDDIFGRTKHDTRTITIEKHIKPPISWIAILCLCIGFVILLFLSILLVYGLTEKGRAHYKNLYIYYFGKEVDFERRWRYSLFMDTVDEKNALLDAVREGNRPNLLKALRNGAYIDVYNKYGNTALHLATKFALPDHVELLIKFGADRTLLNSKNLIPIQMIPYEYEKNFPKRVDKYDEIKRIYRKYEKKAFKICVPQAFPDSSFHIWMDEKVDETIADHFSEKFRAITSDEPIPTTTHVVFKTDKDGVLDTDRLDALLWVFHGAIIVKEQWISDCVNHETLITRDMDYLIEKVKYKGHTFDTVIQWTEAMAKGTMPYLLGVFVALTCNFKDPKTLLALQTIITTQGGILLDVFPLKTHFNIGSRPYLHANLGPLFLIHDGTMDLSVYKNDSDKMYTLFTEEEFIMFMLKRETNRDTRPNPPNVLAKEDE